MWWLAALDERLKVTVDINCLTDFDSLIAAKGLGHHGICYYHRGVPEAMALSNRGVPRAGHAAGTLRSPVATNGCSG